MYLLQQRKNQHKDTGVEVKGIKQEADRSVWTRIAQEKTGPHEVYYEEATAVAVLGKDLGGSFAILDP